VHPDDIADEDPAVAAEEAVDLVLALRDALTAASTPNKIDYVGDDRAYRRDHRKLAVILDTLGIRTPFPWSTLAAGVAAAKTEHIGNGAYAARRIFFKERADRVLTVLRARIADRAAGDVYAAVTGFGAAADDALADIAGIRAELTRIETNLAVDPGAAISAAKNLVKSTAKTVLCELGEPWDDKGSITAHVTDTMRALGIDNRSVAEHDRELAKLMSSLAGITTTLANLRNRLGIGHGMSAPPVGVDLRHGRLAVRSAIAWCAFVLDTLHDRQSA
jgi:hypothetical protein